MEDSKKLIKISENIKTIADNLLNEKNIVEILSMFGEPLIIGSYALNLMIDEDIDIVIKTKSPRESAINVLNKFIELGTFQKYGFGDFKKFPINGRPNGYIVTLRTEYNKTKWELEIWILEEIVQYLEQMKKFKKLINDKNRLEILGMKYQRKILGQSKNDISSFEIYNKIFNTGKNIL